MYEKGTEALDRVAGVWPAGYRSPGLDLTDDSIRLLAELGFRYDSSLAADDYNCYFARTGDVPRTDGGFLFGSRARSWRSVSWSWDDFPSSSSSRRRASAPARLPARRRCSRSGPATSTSWSSGCQRGVRPHRHPQVIGRAPDQLLEQVSSTASNIPDSGSPGWASRGGVPRPIGQASWPAVLTAPAAAARPRDRARHWAGPHKRSRRRGRAGRPSRSSTADPATTRRGPGPHRRPIVLPTAATCSARRCRRLPCHQQVRKAAARRRCRNSGASRRRSRSPARSASARVRGPGPARARGQPGHRPHGRSVNSRRRVQRRRLNDIRAWWSAPGT